MMQVQDEIEDPEGYCMLKIEKIEPIHGSLRQGVQMGHIKPDRAEELKSKFEDLREALRMKFATQRKLAAEKSELEFEKQQQEGKLEKSRKEAKRDAETIAIIGEDAEEADAEAAMALERCDKALVEMEEDRTMKISYQQRILEIKREHVLALEPVISRLKQEIKTEGEEIKERIGKLAQSVKEIEDSKSNHVRLMEETKSLNMDRVDVNTKLEELAGKPETLKKQVDILRNAIKASYAQLEKWTAKIGDAEKQLHGVKATIKSKKEEHVHAVASYHKMRLNEQEQERIANDSAQTLQRALGDAEVYYNDQVYLDLQLMGRLLDLKHVQELHVKALREREKTLNRLQQVQEQVQELQANLPVYNQEKKKAHKEFLTVEEETMKWEEVVANSRRDVVQTLQSLRKSELLGDEVLKQVRDCNRKVQELEKEMAKLIKEDRRVEKVKSDLKKQTERLSRLAALKFSMWKETLKRVEVEQGYIKGFMKRVEQLMKENQDNVLLYNNIRSQRNRLLRSVEESAVTILEMRDKLSPMTQQMENLRNDVTYKITVYDKLHEHVLDCLQASAYVKQDISKCYITLAQTKFLIQEIKLEKHRLEEFIEKKAQMNKKMIKEYTVHITKRNAYGLQVIDRNDELSIMYEKCNVQVDLLKFSELERNKRIDEIELLRRACDMTYMDIAIEKRNTPDPTAMLKEFQSLQEQVKTARATLEQLSELCENPFRETKRWRQLQGFELKLMDLERKAWATQVFINEKENQAIEKDIILEELAALLKSATRKGALKLTKGKELNKKLNENTRNHMNISRALFATISELALVQARALSMKREKEEACDHLNEAQLRLAAGEDHAKHHLKSRETTQRIPWRPLRPARAVPGAPSLPAFHARHQHSAPHPEVQLVRHKNVARCNQVMKSQRHSNPACCKNSTQPARFCDSVGVLIMQTAMRGHTSQGPLLCNQLVLTHSRACSEILDRERGQQEEYCHIRSIYT